MPALSTVTSCTVDGKEAPDNGAVIQILGDTNNLSGRLVLRRVLTLDNANFDIEPGLTNVLRNSRGEYVVRGRNNVLGLLDSLGTPIRTFGREGGGPGEFHSAVVVAVDSGDTTYVFDMYQKRLTVIDPTLSRPVRTVNTPDLSKQPTFLLLPGSQILVGGEGDSLFNTLRILDADGSVVRAWSVDTMSATRSARNRAGRLREPPTKRAQIMTRWLAPGVMGGVLVARQNSYIIEHWTDSFELDRTFQRKVGWFPTLQQEQMGLSPGIDSVGARIYGVGTDSATGNVVVRILVSASNWKPLAKTTRNSDGASSTHRLNAGELARLFDTIFESFDPRTGQLTASARFPGTYGAVNNGMLFHTVRELPDGGLVIDIVKLELVGKKQPAN